MAGSIRIVRVRPNQTVRLPAELVPGGDYLTPAGDGSQLTGVLHTETDPVFSVSPAAGITTVMIAAWNTAAAPLPPGGFQMLTSPDGTKRGGWAIDNNGEAEWMRVE